MLNAFLTPQSTFYSTSFWIINRPEALEAVSRNLDNSVDEFNDDLDKYDFCRSNKICGVWAEQGTQNFR